MQINKQFIFPFTVFTNSYGLKCKKLRREIQDIPQLKMITNVRLHCSWQPPVLKCCHVYHTKNKRAFVITAEMIKAEYYRDGNLRIKILKNSYPYF